MHSFQKIVSDFATIHCSYVHFAHLIGFVLRVSRTKGYSCESGTSFVDHRSQWKEFDIWNWRKCRELSTFIDANSPNDNRFHTWSSADLNEYRFVLLDTRSALPYDRVWKCTYIAGEMWQNLPLKKEKSALITEQWKRVMLHDQTHQIVHSSAMYWPKNDYQFMNLLKSY